MSSRREVLSQRPVTLFNELRFIVFGLFLKQNKSGVGVVKELGELKSIKVGCWMIKILGRKKI